MASDSWGRVAASSKRHQANLQSQFADLYLGFEEMDLGDEDSRVEYGCPFCAEDFDVVGLCCHVEDEHPLEAKNGICPVCASRVGMDLVGHITTQHGHLFKIQRRRKYRRSSSGSQSALSLLKKELREGHLQSLLGGSAYATPSSNTTPDPLLSSFIYHLPSLSDAGNDVEPVPLDDETLITKSIDEDVRESVQPSLSDKDHRERAQKSEFVRGLVLSTIFHDTL